MVSASRTRSNIIIRLVFTIFLKPLGLVMMLVSWLCQTCIYKISMNIKLNIKSFYWKRLCTADNQFGCQTENIEYLRRFDRNSPRNFSAKGLTKLHIPLICLEDTSSLDKVSYSLDCWSGHKLDIIHYHRTWFSSLVRTVLHEF